MVKDLILFFVIMMACLIAHEAAHAIVAHIYGFDLPVFQIGFGKTVAKIGKLVIKSIPIGAGVGIDCDLGRKDVIYQKMLIRIYVAGVVFNAVAALILFVINKNLQNEYVEMAYQMNLLLFTENVLPKHLGIMTDGQRVIDATKLIKGIKGGFAYDE